MFFTSTKTPFSFSLFIQRLLYLSFGLAILWFVYALYSYITYNHTLEANIKHYVQQETQQVAQHFDVLCNALKTTVTQVVQELATEIPNTQKINELLQKKPTEISSLGIAFAPFAYNDKHLYAPYSTHNKILQLENFGDYTNHAFYQDPIQKGPLFSGPRYDKATQSLVIEYAAPFFDASGKILGIVLANYTLKDLDIFLSTTNLARKGYGAILSSTGEFIMHPNKEYLVHHTTAYDIATPANQYAVLADYAKTQATGFLQILNAVTGQKSLVYYTPLPSPGWLFYGSFVEDELNLDPVTLQHLSIKAWLSFFLVCTLLGLLLAKVSLGTPAKLWATSIIVSVGLLVSIIFLWRLINATQTVSTDAMTVIDNNPSLITAVKKIRHDITALEKESHRHKNKTRTLPPEAELITIPTGIYIHSLDITDIYKTELVCDLWQRYPKKIAESLPQGIVLPQALLLEQTELYHYQTDDADVICWRIHCILRQDFSYLKYPFDPKLVTIIVTPIAFDKPILLTPDLEAYKVLTTTSLPFVTKELEINQWRMQKSFFGYVDKHYLTNFGQYTKKNSVFMSAKIPHLTFNIVLQRSAATTLTIALDPVVIIALFLFCLLLLTGFDLLKIQYVLGTATTLFFTTLISYARFSHDMPVQYVVFLENFYQLLEYLIFFVALITLTYALKLDVPGLRFKNLLIPQLLYWPLILLITLVVTLLTFY